MEGKERPRAGSIGIDEKTLSTLEKFTELRESKFKVTDVLLESNEEGNTVDGVKVEVQMPVANEESAGSKARNKLAELFVDPKTSSKSESGGTEKNGTPETKPATVKKSEEIWVRRIADSSRRSFRSFRGHQLPSILTEDADEVSEEAVYSTLPAGLPRPYIPKEREEDTRTRHCSGDEVIGPSKPSHSKTSSLFDAFRPRSKSDASRLKKPTFISTMRNAVQNSLLSSPNSSSGESQKNQSGSTSGHRPRSGSESLRSPVSKVMDMFRHRSSSVNASDDKRHRSDQPCVDLKCDRLKACWAP